MSLFCLRGCLKRVSWHSNMTAAKMWILWSQRLSLKWADNPTLSRHRKRSRGRGIAPPLSFLLFFRPSFQIWQAQLNSSMDAPSQSHLRSRETPLTLRFIFIVLIYLLILPLHSALWCTCSPVVCRMPSRVSSRVPALVKIQLNVKFDFHI